MMMLRRMTIHSGFCVICERLFTKLDAEVEKVFWRLKYWFSTRIRGCIFPVLIWILTKKLLDRHLYSSFLSRNQYSWFLRFVFVESGSNAVSNGS